MFLKNNDIEPIQTDVYDKDLHDVVSIVELGHPKIVEVITLEDFSNILEIIENHNIHYVYCE